MSSAHEEWLNAHLDRLTHGRWSALGELTYSLIERAEHAEKEVEALREEHSDLLWRVDELMRHLELRCDIVIPGNIEPERQVAGNPGKEPRLQMPAPPDIGA